VGIPRKEGRHLLARKRHFLSPPNGNEIGMIGIGYTFKKTNDASDNEKDAIKKP
jgi:hypothetical protein